MFGELGAEGVVSRRRATLSRAARDGSDEEGVGLAQDEFSSDQV